MKKYFNYLAVVLVAAILFTGCKKEDDDPIIIDNPVYGMQVSGTATTDKALVLDAKQMVEPSSDFATKVERDGMMYGIHFLKAGDISFTDIVADDEISYGVSEVIEVTQDAETGEAFTFKRGKLTEGGTGSFTVAADGLYYIMTDATSSFFWVIPINNFEINVTGDKAVYVSGDADKAIFKAEAVDLRAKFKVRMNTAWKIIAEDVPFGGDFPDDHIRPVISYGGTVTGLTADGEDIEVENNGQLLDFTFTWNTGSKGIAGITLTTEEAGELPPAEYPENLYMIGGSIGGWAWGETDIQMIPTHSNPHLFWRVVWVDIDAGDQGIKFSPEQAWGKDFGVAGEGVDGVYAKGGDNVPSPAVSGYYMLIVNLKEETIEINTPTVYGIGDTFGSWDAAQEVNMFTVDNANEYVKFEAVPNAGELRMHIAAATLTNDEGNAVDWWQAEFIILNDIIEYRGTGDEQDRTTLVGGETVNLKFKDDTGTIN